MQVIRIKYRVFDVNFNLDRTGLKDWTLFDSNEISKDTFKRAAEHLAWSHFPQEIKDADLYSDYCPIVSIEFNGKTYEYEVHRQFVAISTEDLA